MWSATAVEKTVEGGAFRLGWVVADKGGETRETVVGIGLALTYLQILRVSKQFADRKHVFHYRYCLQRGDVLLFPLGATARKIERG